MASTYGVWGWGRAPADQPSEADLAALAPLATGLLGTPIEAPIVPAQLRPLPADRVSSRLPASLASVTSADEADRARHGIGRSYRDVVRAIDGVVAFAPDAVVRPADEAQMTAVLDWCASNNVAVVPFGGGTSVVGGVEPDVGDQWSGAVSLDLERLAGVIEVDATSRAARVLAVRRVRLSKTSCDHIR